MPHKKLSINILLIYLILFKAGGKSVPFISYKYPATFDQDTFSASVTQFCFPDINQFPTEVMPRLAFYTNHNRKIIDNYL